MKKRLIRFLQVAVVVLVIPTQYGPITCTADQIQQYLDWIPEKDTDQRPAKDNDLNERFHNALRNA